jgi:transcriptional regulator with XRE-family HTH domain/mannose-6-phosphate isomerase-like protein (cupin superfamily)
VTLSADRPPIGPRLRDARVRQGLSLTEVADEAGITKGFLSQLERDRTSSSVGTLIEICRVLELSIGELFDGATTPLVRAGERTPISFGGSGVSEYRLTPASEERVMVLLSEIAPGGGSGDDPYALASDAEVAYVLEGTLQIEVGEAAYTVSAGDTLTFNARDSHRWHNPSAALPTRVLWVLAPALNGARKRVRRQGRDEGPGRSSK